ncbi:MAG: iron ABC transporter permease, partial [Eudoraea sp.]|nr:iron ABC transporter permease [Eudoraea sp.]
MQTSKIHITGFIYLGILLVLNLGVNISLGSVNIPLQETIKAVLGSQETASSWEYIIWDYRIPKALTAILV